MKTKYIKPILFVLSVTLLVPAWNAAGAEVGHYAPGVHDEVHGVGGQLGLTYVPWALSVNFRYLYEFSAADRFQGQSIGLNIGKKF